MELCNVCHRVTYTDNTYASVLCCASGEDVHYVANIVCVWMLLYIVRLCV